MAAEDGIADAVVHLAGAAALGFHPIQGEGDGFTRAHTVPFPRVAEDGALVRANGFLGVHILEDGRNDKVKMLGKAPIALVAGGNRHDGTGSVPRENVVCNPDGNKGSSDGVHDVSAGEHPRNAFVALAIALGFHAGGLDVGFDFAPLCVGCQSGHQVVFRSEDHEGHPVQGVGTGCEDFDFGARRIGLSGIVGHGEPNGRAFGATNPVPLGFLDAVGPIEVIQAGQQAVGISGDAHHPLPHGLLHDGVPAALAQAIFHFVVRKHGAKGWAPVDFAVCEVGDAEAHEHFLALTLAHALPICGGEGAVKVCSKMREGQPLPPAFVTSGVDIEVAIFGTQQIERR